MAVCSLQGQSWLCKQRLFSVGIFPCILNKNVLKWKIQSESGCLAHSQMLVYQGLSYMNILRMRMN